MPRASVRVRKPNPLRDAVAPDDNQSPELRHDRSRSEGDDCASNRSVRPWRTDEWGDGMKRWIVGTAITLGLAIVALLGVIGYTAVGRARGESWSSFTGPEPVWPAVVGFGAMYLIPLAAVLLVVLVATAVVRAYIPRTPAPR